MLREKLQKQDNRQENEGHMIPAVLSAPPCSRAVFIVIQDIFPLQWKEITYKHTSESRKKLHEVRITL